MGQFFDNSKGASVLLKMVKGIQENKVLLGDIDGLIGDGDHGMNMNKGFSEYEKRFGDKDISFSEGLDELSSILMNEIGGSMGPIYGTILGAMAESLEGKDKIILSDLSKAFDYAKDELFDIVDARVGDKTLVDAFSPACDALREGGDFKTALVDMAGRAEKGKESTKDLQAKYGRSSRLGARSIGVLDAGASSCAIILQSMSLGIREILEEE